MSNQDREIRLVDTHAHLMDPAFAGELPEVLDRAVRAGVVRILCVGYDLATSRAAVSLARAYPDRLRAAVGIHPNEASRATSADYEAIRALTFDPLVVAIGETGLDYYRDRTTPERQRWSLEWHLHLAETQRLPVIVHSRGAVEADLAPMLEQSAARRDPDDVPGVMHCFSSERTDFLDRVVGASYYVSFAGPVTFKNAGALSQMVALVPEDRMLVETDSPYLAPHPHRGQRNEPAHVRLTAERLAAIRRTDLASLADHMWSNARRLLPALIDTPVEVGA